MYIHEITVIFNGDMFCNQPFGTQLQILKRVIVKLRYVPHSHDSNVTDPCHRFDFGLGKTMSNQLEYKVHTEDVKKRRCQVVQQLNKQNLLRMQEMLAFY